MTTRARMALQLRPQPPERNSEAIHGWPCMLAQTLQRSIVRYSGWGLVVWSVRRGSSERRHVQLDLSINIPIVFSLVTYVIHVRNTMQQSK